MAQNMDNNDPRFVGAIRSPEGHLRCEECKQGIEPCEFPTSQFVPRGLIVRLPTRQPVYKCLLGNVWAYHLNCFDKASERQDPVPRYLATRLPLVVGQWDPATSSSSGSLAAPANSSPEFPAAANSMPDSPAPASPGSDRPAPANSGSDPVALAPANPSSDSTAAAGNSRRRYSCKRKASS